MADIDPSLMQQVFNISERKRKPHIHHHGKSDDLGTGFEIVKRRGFNHPPKLQNHPARLNRVSSDRAKQTHYITVANFYTKVPFLKNRNVVETSVRKDLTKRNRLDAFG